MAKLTAFGMRAKNSPVEPVISSMGRKAATVVAVAETTGNITSLVPSMMACCRSSPCCTWR